MQTRKEQLFNGKTSTPASRVIPATIKFVHNKKRGLIEPLSAQEKMLCALRKVLAAMGNKDESGRRFYIAANKVEVLQAPVTTNAKAGSAQSYKAVGRCQLGVCHPDGHRTSMFIEFTISFRDTEEERGMADVEYFDPTTIDVIDRSGPVNLNHLQ